MKKILALSGALSSITGCFLPIMHIGQDSLNFFDPPPVTIPDVPQNALMYVAIVIIAIALSCSILALFNKTKWLWLSGILTGAILTAVYFGMHAKVNEMKEQADKQVNDLFGGLFKGMTDSVFKTIDIGGLAWYVISAGALLFIIASFIPKKNTINLTNK